MYDGYWVSGIYLQVNTHTRWKNNGYRMSGIARVQSPVWEASRRIAGSTFGKHKKCDQLVVSCGDTYLVENVPSHVSHGQTGKRAPPLFSPLFDPKEIFDLATTATTSSSILFTIPLDSPLAHIISACKGCTLSPLPIGAADKTSSGSQSRGKGGDVAIWKRWSICN